MKNKTDYYLNYSDNVVFINDKIKLLIVLTIKDKTKLFTEPHSSTG